MKDRSLGKALAAVGRVAIAVLLAAILLQAQQVRVDLNTAHGLRVGLTSDTVSASCNGPVVYGTFTMASQGHGDGTVNTCTGNCPPYWNPGCKYVQGEAWNDVYNVWLEACDSGTGTHCDGLRYELIPGGYSQSVGDIYIKSGSNAQGYINPPNGPIGSAFF